MIKKEITSLNLPVSQPNQDQIQSHTSQRGNAKESVHQTSTRF